ncbi:MAG TPA: response regulator [Chloroflexota bacterium]|nr:response regulator [Chloroflexota bacterium]
MAMISDLLAARQARRAALGAFGTTPSQPAAPAQPEDTDWPVVLVVDDSPTIRKIVEVTLRRERIKVIGVPDGLSALAAVADKQPRLVLLDITLPGMDGYQICQVLKQRPTSKNIPVVMLSGRDGFFDRMRGKLVGSTQYVTKPFDPAALVKAVTRHLPDSRGTRPVQTV